MHSTDPIKLAPIDVTKKVAQATTIIHALAPDIQPEVAIICGSGLGALADAITDTTKIPYHAIPGFPHCTVAGHAGELIMGRLAGRQVMCLVGRAHLYEGGNVAIIRSFIRTIKNMGVNSLLVTSAVGSLHEHMPPGELVLIEDHINFQFNNPLLGRNEDNFGPRFVGLENSYHSVLRKQLQAAANHTKCQLHSGVFIGTLGPSFETPAEIRAFKTLGGDVVGMSVIPEIIVAKHCGLAAAAVSVVTNLAAGLSPQALSHEVTLQGAAQGTDALIQLIKQFVDTWEPVNAHKSP